MKIQNEKSMKRDTYKMYWFIIDIYQLNKENKREEIESDQAYKQY